MSAVETSTKPPQYRGTHRSPEPPAADLLAELPGESTRVLTVAPKLAVLPMPLPVRMPGAALANEESHRRLDAPVRLLAAVLRSLRKSVTA